MSKSTERKALLAMIFAGGLLNAQLPVLSEEKSESTDSVIYGIANNSQIAPEVRAFYLLKLASWYLDGGDRAVAESQYSAAAHGPDKINTSRWWEGMLLEWANDVPRRNRPVKKRTSANIEPVAAPRTVDQENSVLADIAMKKAWMQLGKSSGDEFGKLNLYFIASTLYQKMGDEDGAAKCNKVLDEAFLHCERSSPVSEPEIKAVESVLNSMANRLIPVLIPVVEAQDGIVAQQTQVLSFTEKDFKESERIKLRAIAIADRLPATADVRRRAHRDLSLWYAQLGKKVLAEKEKQVLFELVGVKDDKILYPQSVGCGHLKWWGTERQMYVMGCGMG